MADFELVVNGVKQRVEADPETPLLWILRDHLGLTGTKYSCGIAECGNCKVLLDGEVEPSCAVSVAAASGSEIITVEGLADAGFGFLLDIWEVEQVPQCGYCQPAHLISAAALVRRDPPPVDGTVGDVMSGVICRCGTYPRIRRAVARALKEASRG